MIRSFSGNFVRSQLQHHFAVAAAVLFAIALSAGTRAEAQCTYAAPRHCSSDYCEIDCPVSADYLVFGRTYSGGQYKFAVCRFAIASGGTKGTFQDRTIVSTTSADYRLRADGTSSSGAGDVIRLAAPSGEACGTGVTIYGNFPQSSDTMLIWGDGGDDFIFRCATDRWSSAWCSDLTANCASQAIRIDGRAGNDFIAGSSAADNVWGGTGLDVIVGCDGNDTLRGGDGQDSLHGNEQNSETSGSSDSDTLEGDADADYIWAGPGNDTIRGGTGSDALHGGPGDDNVYGELGCDVVWGDTGYSDVCICEPEPTEGGSTTCLGNPGMFHGCDTLTRCTGCSGC